MFAFEYLRENVLFLLSLVFCVAVVVLVPQINGVMLQTVETPEIANPKGVLYYGLLEPSTKEAAGFLLFLSLLFAGSAAAILWVLPTSWFLPPYGVPAPGSWREKFRPYFPIPWWFEPRFGGVLPYSAPWPGWAWFGLAAVSLAALPVLVIYRVPSKAILPFTSYLVFPLLCFAIDRICSGFYRLAGSSPPSSRWMWGTVFAIPALPILWFWSSIAGPFDKPYLLCGCTLPMLLGYLILLGVWLALPAGPSHLAFGRLLGWVLASSVFGEFFWLAAECSWTKDIFSYRLYTIWAVLQLLILVIQVAAFLDTFERNRAFPWRIIGLVGLTVLFFESGVPDPEPLRDLERSTPSSEVVSDEWAARFLNRIEAIEDKKGPVVFVASSGGGSRAAIFAGLVLEALSREPFGEGATTTWGNHIVLVSGVSGGSLGSARYIHGLRSTWAQTYKDNARPNLVNSVRAELARRMEEKATKLLEDIDKEEKGLGKPSDYRVPAEETLEFCKWFRMHAFDKDLYDPNLPPTDPRWIIHSGIMDDLCTDFMAPILRGVLTPVYSRGETLRRFWTGKFEWNSSRDRDGYAVGSEGPSYAPDRFPLALYNTSDVRRGCRMTVGFPPLPVGFLRDLPPAAGPDDSQRWRPQNPPEVLADLDPASSLCLADAVGLSANFPFGFNAVKIPRHRFDDLLPVGKAMTPESNKAIAEGLKEKDDLEAKLLDGGIVDNTGIDSLYLVVETLREKARAASKRGDEKDTYAKIWKQLIARRVYLIEIDSGAKPDKPGVATRDFSLLFDPLASLNNAGYTNASRDKNQYYIDLGVRFTDEANLSGPLAELAADGKALSPEEKKVQEKLDAIQRQGIPRFAHLTFDANHFAADNVLTAWSLAPSDKALLLVRFLTELKARQGQLAKLVKVSEEEDERDQLLRALTKARASRRLQQGLEALEKETKEFARLAREKKLAAAELAKKLTLLRSRLREVQEQSVVAGIGNEEVQRRLARLQQAVTEAQQSLRTNAPAIPPNVLKTLVISREGELGQLLADLPGQRAKAIQASFEIYDAGSATREVQREIINTTMEGRILFDRPTPKR